MALAAAPASRDNLNAASDSIPFIEKGICTLGTTMNKAGSKAAFRKVDYDYVLAFIELCIAKNAKHIAIVTAMGASSTSMFFYNQVKGDVERDAQILCDKHNVNLSIIRPSLIMEENRDEQRIGEKIGIVVMRIIQPLLFGPMKKYRGVTPKQIAKTLISASKTGKSSIIESDEVLKSA